MSVAKPMDDRGRSQKPNNRADRHPREEQTDGAGADAEVTLDSWESGAPGRDGDPTQAKRRSDRSSPPAQGGTLDGNGCAGHASVDALHRVGGSGLALRRAGGVQRLFRQGGVEVTREVKSAHTGDS